MKHLIATTALALVLSVPAVGYGQTAAPAASPAVASQTTDTRGLLSARGQHDLFATDLIGHDVYARRAADDRTTSAERATSQERATNRDRTAPQSEARRQDGTATPGRAAAPATGARTAVPITSAELDAMDNIGQINDMVLSRDGNVRAIVIGIGGFLGVGEQDVAVTMDQVTFASDPDDRSQMYIVVNTGAEVLKDSPAYDRTSMSTDRAPGNAEPRSDRPAFAAPEIARDGYDRVEATEVSTEILMGKSVYDVNDNDVGTVTDMIIDDAGAITNVIIDFGGFLGMGQSQVSIGFDELTILSTEGYSDVRVYVDATKQQIQDRPRYQAKN